MSAPVHFECPSCPSCMGDMRNCVREAGRAFGFDEETLNLLVLAIDEACTNVIRYAYGGKNDGRIEIDICAQKPWWEVRIRDYGNKCDPATLKGRNLEDVRPGGLGLFFIEQAFDEVHFDHTLSAGTCLILRKKLKKVKSKP